MWRNYFIWRRNISKQIVYSLDPSSHLLEAFFLEEESWFYEIYCWASFWKPLFIDAYLICMSFSPKDYLFIEFIDDFYKPMLYFFRWFFYFWSKRLNFFWKIWNTSPDIMDIFWRNFHIAVINIHVRKHCRIVVKELFFLYQSKSRISLKVKEKNDYRTKKDKNEKIDCHIY